MTHRDIDILLTVTSDSAVCVIVNPRAAYGQAAKMWPGIRLQFEHNGVHVVEHFTQGMMHAMSLAVECIQNGAKMIVCVGGDGTLNEIINGMMQSGADRGQLPELAIIPVGTGSDFARTLGITREVEKSVAAIVRGQTMDVDIGKVVFTTQRHRWVRYFINVFDVGLGGKVVRIANRIPKNIGGFLTFLLSSLVALVTFRHMDVTIDIDGNYVDRDLMWIVGTANGQFFGGGMHMAPMAKIDDGAFEILFVRDTSIFKFIVHVLGKVYDGKHLEYHNVHHYRGSQVRIVSEHPCLIDIDGEEEKAHEVVVSLIPQAIKVVVP